MWFGQKLHKIKGKTVFGAWKPYATREEAVWDGNDLVSVLELCCTVAQYESWLASQSQTDGKARKQRLTMPFRGPFYADFDAHDNLGLLQSQLYQALSAIIAEYGATPADFSIWFSGAKGFHLIIPASVFAPKDFQHPRLPSLYKRFAKALGLAEIMDSAVYSEGRGRLWRVEGRVRDNGNRKIPLTFGQLRDLSPATLQHLSSLPAYPALEPSEPPAANAGLTRLFRGVWTGFEKEQRRRPAPKPKRPSGASVFDGASINETNLSRIVDALDALPDSMVDDYDGWIRIGMILHHATEGDELGLRLWEEWSRRSAKFDAESLAAKWQGFQANLEGGLTLGTLFYLAEEASS